MSKDLLIIKNKDKKPLKNKLKKLENADGFIAITIKREGFCATFSHERYSMSDEEIVYALENLKLQILKND